MKTRTLKHLAVGSMLTVVLLRLAPVSEAQLTSPTFWVAADQLSGSPVTSWNNTGSASAAVPSVSNGGSATGPVLNPNDPLNGVNSVGFSAGDFLDAGTTGGNLFSGTDSTVFIVQKDNGGADGNSLNWHTLDGNSYLSMNAAYGGNIVFDSGSGNDYITADISSRLNFYGQWHVITGVRSGLTGEIHLDGENLTLIPADTFSEAADTGTSGTLSIGGLRGSGTSTLNGSIAEVLIFSTALTADDIATVEGNLGAKYGISVVPEPQAYATAFSFLCLVGGLAVHLRRRLA
jgi:hypothetical protein